MELCNSCYFKLRKLRGGLRPVFSVQASKGVCAECGAKKMVTPYAAGGTTRAVPSPQRKHG